MCNRSCIRCLFLEKNATKKIDEELFKSTKGSDYRVGETEQVVDSINPPLFIVHNPQKRNNEPSFVTGLYVPLIYLVVKGDLLTEIETDKTVQLRFGLLACILIRIGSKLKVFRYFRVRD